MKSSVGLICWRRLAGVRHILDDLDLNPLLITVDGAHNIVYNRDKDRNAVPDTLDAEIVRDAARFLKDGEKMQLSYASPEHAPHRRNPYFQPHCAEFRHAEHVPG